MNRDRHNRHNVACMATGESLWGFSNALIAPMTILTALLHSQGASGLIQESWIPALVPSGRLGSFALVIGGNLVGCGVEFAMLPCAHGLSVDCLQEESLLCSDRFSCVLEQLMELQLCPLEHPAHA